jgi:glycosyltransferase involved in cell wall biosynthesis
VLFSAPGGWQTARTQAGAAGPDDILMINGDTGFLLSLCALRATRQLRARLVGLDLVLPTPRSIPQRVAAPVRRQLLREVTLFINFFRELSGYARHYGVSAARSRYVAFKSNLWQYGATLPAPVEPGDYVLAMGRSNRDYPTFLRAMAKCKLPGVLVYPGNTELLAHGSQAIPAGLVPPNVTLVEHHGNHLDWALHALRARVVAVPLRGDTITAAGISVYLDAMLLGKCVVATRGPSTVGLLGDEAMVVEPESVDSLAEMISLAWHDDHARASTVAAGARYARALQGTDRLAADVAGVLGLATCPPLEG